jgi:ribosomal protein S18 acetylase RimI-like enzyme
LTKNHSWPNPIAIRAASWRDFPGILALERVCFGRDAWPWIDLLAALTFPGTVRLKAVCAEQMIGFVIGDRRRGRGLAWIASLGVHPTYRRRGVGRRLLEACEQELATARIRLTLRRSNQAALQLYLGEGYSEVGVWARYYRDGEDAVVMEKRRQAEAG